LLKIYLESRYQKIYLSKVTK